MKTNFEKVMRRENKPITMAQDNGDTKSFKFQVSDFPPLQGEELENKNKKKDVTPAPKKSKEKPVPNITFGWNEPALLHEAAPNITFGWNEPALLHEAAPITTFGWNIPALPAVSPKVEMPPEVKELQAAADPTPQPALVLEPRQAAADPTPQPASAPELQPSTSSELLPSDTLIKSSVVPEPPVITTTELAEIQQDDAETSGSRKRHRLDKKGRRLVKLEAENAALVKEKEQLKAMFEMAKEESENTKAALHPKDTERMDTDASLKIEQLEATVTNEKHQKIQAWKLLTQQLSEARRLKEELTQAKRQFEEEKHEKEQDRSRLLAEHSETTAEIKAAAMKAQEDLENERSQWLQEKSSIEAALTTLRQSIEETVEDKDKIIADLMDQVKTLEQAQKKTKKKRSLWKRFTRLFRRS